MLERLLSGRPIGMQNQAAYSTGKFEGSFVDVKFFLPGEQAVKEQNLNFEWYEAATSPIPATAIPWPHLEVKSETGSLYEARGKRAACGRVKPVEHSEVRMDELRS